MVFSSFPVYLDHSNLHQLQQNFHQQQGSGIDGQQITPAPPAVAPVGPGSIRPGSMVDRARLARMPLPENGLKCPRCDSTSTKFCYFNNYSLTQPRHFCKSCRRYWTRGGALRNVPVGGGCRRNKRSKGGSKSATASSKQSGGVGGGSSSTGDVACPNNSVDVSGNFSQPMSVQSPLMAAFQAAGLSHYGGGNDISSSNIGLFQPPPPLSATTSENNGVFGEMSFQIGRNNSGGGAEPWRLPASLAGFEPQTSSDLFPFQSEEIEPSSSRVISHHEQIKLEESRGLNSNSTKQFLGVLGNNQYWGGGADGGGGSNTWTGGYSGHFNSSSASSTSHLL